MKGTPDASSRSPMIFMSCSISYEPAIKMVAHATGSGPSMEGIGSITTPCRFDRRTESNDEEEQNLLVVRP